MSRSRRDGSARPVLPSVTVAVAVAVVVTAVLVAGLGTAHAAQASSVPAPAADLDGEQPLAVERLPDAGAPGGAVADPVARCSVSETTVAPGESVTLDASASEDATAYRFDEFGDGSFGAWQDTPTTTVAYDQEGTYEPQVQVRSPDDLTDTASCGTVTVETANDPPDADYTYSPSAPTAGETVTFDSSSSDPDGEIVEHEWYVDGDPVGQGSTLDYSFPEPGEYTVELTVEDDDGASDTRFETVTVEDDNEPPTARLEIGVTTVAPGETLEFGSTSSDPDGEIVSQVWRVGGERVGEGFEFSYTFPEPGEYTVELTVEDDDGTTDTDTVTITVESENEPPTVEVDYAPTEPAPEETVVFEAAASDPDGSIESFQWRVDGEPVGSGAALEYAFPEPGEYAVGVTVTDDEGATTTAERTVTVEPQQTTTRTPTGDVQLTAEWWLTPSEPQAGESATLVAEGPADPRVTYRWRVNGGETTLSGQVVDYAFPEPGEYTVTLEVAGPDGESETQSRTVSVFERRSGEGGDGGPAFGLTPANPLPGETVTLVADPLGPDAQYRWDLDDDGEPDERGRVVRYAFPNGTDVTVTLETVDGDGQTERSSTDVSAEGDPVSEPPSRSGPSMDVVPSNPNPGETVTLVASAGDDAEVERYRWDLDGDGEPDAQGEVVTHTFPEDGTVSVGLAVVGTDGGTTDVERTVGVGNATVESTTTELGATTTTTDGGTNTTTDDTTTEETPDRADGGGVPGLGVAAALVAVAVAALLARRGDR